MASIVLATLNARYSHCAFGLRYLLANMDDLASETEMLEFVVQDHSIEIVASVLKHQPQIVGFGVYIWNVDATWRVISELKKLRPEIVVVLGGPEVSYEIELQPICHLADYVIAGEADLAFANLCRRILNNDRPTSKIITAALPNVSDLRLPYHLYDEDDIANRVIYVEASRGCPFSCEFCLSSLDIPVRSFSPERFLESIEQLWNRGARQFKFVDRTFNLNARVGQTILQFFLDRIEGGMFLHFEMIPDRLPNALRNLIKQFPPGVLQFEVGIQSFDEQVGQLINRKQVTERIEENFEFLRRETGVHIHADLIVGLPSETLQSFGVGFNRLISLRPQEIQIGILKRLRGTPIIRHDETWKMIYSDQPPYEVLSTSTMAFEEIHRMRTFSRFWDLVANSGNFLNTLQLILDQAPFERFLQFSDWIYEQNKQTYAISLLRLVKYLLDYLTKVCGMERELVVASLQNDYCRDGKRELPHFLHGSDGPAAKSKVGASKAHPLNSHPHLDKLPPRQSRHIRS